MTVTDADATHAWAEHHGMSNTADHDRDELVRVVGEAFAARLGGDWEDWLDDAETAVDALLAHIASQPETSP